jgi:hypothetical protein
LYFCSFYYPVLAVKDLFSLDFVKIFSYKYIISFNSYLQEVIIYTKLLKVRSYTIFYNIRRNFMLSKAKSQAMAREMKSALEKRGFSVVESDLAKGKKLVLDACISIRIEAKDAVSKDIFGNPVDAFAPHEVKLAIDNDLATHSQVAKAMMELGKQGVGLKIGEADTLAAAETAADSAEEQRYNVMWPTKGA